MEHPSEEVIVMWELLQFLIPAGAGFVISEVWHLIKTGRSNLQERMDKQRIRDLESKVRSLRLDKERLWATAKETVTRLPEEEKRELMERLNREGTHSLIDHKA